MRSYRQRPNVGAPLPRNERQGGKRRQGFSLALSHAIHRLLHQPIACILMIAVAASAAACSRTQSPVAPAPLPVPAVVLPAPTPAAEVTLKGHVTEAPPTSTTGVWDATVTLDDGLNTWQSARTIGDVGRGEYTISGLHAGRYHAKISADGFVGVTQNIILGTDNAIDFHLLPVALRKSITVSDHLSDLDGTCSDGTQMRPCHIVALPVHNRGPIDATLTSPAGGAALALSLFERGSAVPLATLTSMVNGTGQLVTNVEGGAIYEVRVIYASGKGSVSYSLSIAYPN
jgi:hypothetical protein